jgi:allophanate hydrolase subunit 1
MDGITTFASPAANTLQVNFDEQKTDAEKIRQALIAGGLDVQEEQAPAP